jgi:hypothetical protein
MTLREFAKAEGLSAKTLENRKYAEARRLRDELGAATTAPKKPRDLFVELPPATITSDLRFEVEVKNGRKVRVPATFHTDALARLLRVMEAQS